MKLPTKKRCIRGHRLTRKNLSWNGRSWSCRTCASESGKRRRKQARQRDPIGVMVSQTRRNAIKRGYEFTITKTDLLPAPTHCPMLGMELDYFATLGGQIRTTNAASIDRTNSAKGYVPGNVAIISARANRIKNDSSLDDARKLLSYLKRLTVGVQNR